MVKNKSWYKVITPAQIVELNALRLDKHLNAMYKNGIDKKRKAGWADDFGDMTETDAE